MISPKQDNSAAEDDVREPLGLELLIPAGGREQLEYAVHFGADAVYLASERFGMRKRAENFTCEDLADAIAFAHEHGVAVHVAVNTLMTDDEIEELPDYLAFLKQAGADALIMSDLGAITLAKMHAPSVAIHLSTQASCMNAAAARAWYDLGVKRIVCAREMTLEQIRQLRQNIPADMELETFVHGAMCMAYSGRCIISDYLNARSANHGHCTQPCRWNYALVEESRPGEYFPIEQDAHGTYIMSSRDMNMLAHLDELAAAGVTSIKVEGRAKGTYYVAAVANAYRQVLDGGDPAVWESELDAVSHRPYSTGFYFGTPGQNVDAATEYIRARKLIACVTDCRPDGASYLVSVICRNRFVEGDIFEALSPGEPIRRGRVDDLVLHLSDEQPERVFVANRTMQTYTFHCRFPLAPYDILRTLGPDA